MFVDEILEWFNSLKCPSSLCPTPYPQMGGQTRDWTTGQQEEEDGKSHARDERDKAITSVFCRDRH